jgi:hypothetical protein
MKRLLYNPKEKERKCRVCEITQPISRFNLSRWNIPKTYKYYNRKCKDCEAEYKKEYWERNKKKIMKARAPFEKTPLGKWYSYRVHSKVRHKKFELTKEYFIDLIQKPCYYCGTLPANGIDRIDNNEGYIITNSLPCCGDCNRGKFTNSASYFINHCKKVVKHQEGF